MCTLAVYFRVFPSRPVVVAANRDELLARPAAPPTLLRDEPPRAFGGRDLVAGGTWLGVNDAGLVAGLLNRRAPAPPDPGRRSRGLLCLDALEARRAREAAARVLREPAGHHNPFNLLVVDPEDAVVLVQARDGAPRAAALEPGVHVLTNLDVNDPTCPRIAASHRRFVAAGDAFRADGDEAAFVRRLRDVLADHATPADPRGPGSLCVHAGAYGTRSSSVILVGRRGTRTFFADGPPCRTPLAEVPPPFGGAP
ncbi:MAG TPA: NRDE family protein [Candidatus Binatia bacterium]|nr:NRDE family protein [Candidatus Binatia bacterium]